MQTINITEEMKADAINLLNAVKEFKTKYGLKMVSVNDFTCEKKVNIFGDTDEAGGFNVYHIFSDGQESETYIKGDKEESEEIEEEE
jgi:hypothetical protein